MRALLLNATVEVIPLRGVQAALAGIPRETAVTVTCSPKFGIARTLEHARLCRDLGLRVIPHVAARQVPDEARLRQLVEELDAIAVRDLFVIGGDLGEPVGELSSASELLEALAGIGHRFETIGIGCYPEGHPAIADDVLLEALRRKQPHAQYMVSQLCFDPATVLGWLRRMRASGIHLPLHIGVAGPVHARKLVDMSVKIGVGTSVRYLTKQHGFVRNLLRVGAYRPERLLAKLAGGLANPGGALATPGLSIDGIHIYSFNQIAATIEWLSRQTAGAAPGPGLPGPGSPSSEAPSAEAASPGAPPRPAPSREAPPRQAPGREARSSEPR
ncbi:MAG TPA: methylenetetrahydrofolate reductase [Acidimicrobiales bacterium]|nr:methylenetetrahydrofolate reductase [Acidimicrobiales bacterium]